MLRSRFHLLIAILGCPAAPPVPGGGTEGEASSDSVDAGGSTEATLSASSVDPASATSTDSAPPTTTGAESTDLQGFSCTDLGLPAGILRCDPVTCTFDTSGCA